VGPVFIPPCQGGVPEGRGGQASPIEPPRRYAPPLLIQGGESIPTHARLSGIVFARNHLRPWAEALTPCFPPRVGVKPPSEDTGVNPVRLRPAARGESLRPRRLAPAGLGKGMRRGCFDHPTLDHPRQGAPAIEFTAGVRVSPTPLARHAVPPRWGLEAVDPSPTPPRWLAGVAWMERSLRSVIQVLLAERMIMAWFSTLWGMPEAFPCHVC